MLVVRCKSARFFFFPCPFASFSMTVFFERVSCLFAIDIGMDLVKSRFLSESSNSEQKEPRRSQPMYRRAKGRQLLERFFPHLIA